MAQERPRNRYILDQHVFQIDMHHSWQDIKLSAFYFPKMIPKMSIIFFKFFLCLEWIWIVDNGTTI